MSTQAEYNRAWYAKNKQYVINRNKAYILKLLKEVSDYKESQPCADCGGFYPACAMDFDHVRGDKINNISELVSRGSRKKVWEEIDKCELVCAICHRLRTDVLWDRIRIHESPKRDKFTVCRICSKELNQECKVPGKRMCDSCYRETQKTVMRNRRERLRTQGL